MSDKYSEARKLLTNGARDAFTKLRSEHANESFYAFALRNDDDGVALDIAANSEQSLQRRSANSGVDPVTTRWSAEEWVYIGGFANVIPNVYSMISDGEEEEDEDFDKTRGAVFALTVLALADLEKDGFFGKGEARKKVTLLCTLSDSEHTEWLEHESVRRLNPPEVYERMCKQWLIPDEKLAKARKDLGTYRVFLRVLARAAGTEKEAAPESGKTRRFEFSEGKSKKFWEITVSGSDVTVRFGRIGTQVQTQTKSFSDSDKADKHAAKLIEEKFAKGYQELA
jgi:predicted DNA-binding WGR domain protein